MNMNMACCMILAETVLINANDTYNEGKDSKSDKKFKEYLLLQLYG
jgi:hypothetical protein